MSYVVKDKCKAVACRILAENEHDLHAVARRINKMWLKLRDLIKAGEKDELEEWRNKEFDLGSVKENVKASK